MLRLKRVVEGLTSVALGAIIIANSVGVLPWRVWITILSLWPLLLVAIGMDLIGKGAKLGTLRVLSSLLLLCGLLYAVTIAPVGGLSWTFGSQRVESFDVRTPPAPRISQASATISLPAASLDIRSGDAFFSAAGTLPGGAPTLDETRASDHSVIELRANSGSAVVFPNNAYADIELGRRVTWNLSLETGASQGDIDLSGLTVSGVDIQAGVGVLDLTLGEPSASNSKDVPVNLDTALSDVTIRVPEGEEARIEVHTGLSTVDAPSDWARVGGERIWESPGYGNASQRYLIVVDGAMGIIDITTD